MWHYSEVNRPIAGNNHQPLHQTAMNPTAKIVYDTILQRRSVRQFAPDTALSEQTLDCLLTAGDAAPSAGNLKSRRLHPVTQRADLYFVISHIFSARVRKELAAFKHAAAFILLCADIPHCRQKYPRGNLYAVQDASLAGQNILLMAHALGLGGCWIGQVNGSALLPHFGLEPPLKLVGIIALGGMIGEAGSVSSASVELARQTQRT